MKIRLVLLALTMSISLTGCFFPGHGYDRGSDRGGHGCDRDHDRDCHNDNDHHDDHGGGRY